MPEWFSSWKKRVLQLRTEIYALYLAYKDPRVPWYARIFAGCVVGYAFSPIDLIPDFIPIIGYLDDILIVPLGIIIAIKLIPPQVLWECRMKAQKVMEQGQPTNWMAALVIVAVWLALTVIAVWWLLKVFRK